MYFVPSPREAAQWYSMLFSAAIAPAGNPEHVFIRMGAHEVWFHRADSKVSAGAAGQVAYWQVDSFDAALVKAQELGAVLYRGPLDRGDGFFMCQVKDPFGNLIGLVGPRLMA